MPDKGWANEGIRVTAVRIDDTGAQIGGFFVSLKAETFLTETLSSYAGGGGSDSAAKRIERIERIAPGTIETLWVDRRPLPEVGHASGGSAGAGRRRQITCCDRLSGSGSE